MKQTFVLTATVFFTVMTQAQSADTTLQQANLPTLIKYALQHQPQIKQSQLGEDITTLQIKSKLADWYPQVNFGYNYQHTFDVATSIIGGNPVQLGVTNTSNVQLAATQNIFNRDLLLARRTKNEVQKSAAIQTETITTNIVVSVSKAYYDLIATSQQLNVINENIVRLKRSLNDAKARYDVGVVDKIDYKRATIALNTAEATRKQLQEAIIAKNINLKAILNYPEMTVFSIDGDTTVLEQDLFLDTLQQPNFNNRVEYRQFDNNLKLQQANLTYNKWSYLPTVSANGAYIRNFLNNDFGRLYSNSFPNSYAGLTLAFPIFQGNKRNHNIRIAEKQVDQVKLSMTNFLNQANGEYATALANYKSNYASYLVLKQNRDLAAEVYDVVQLQYREGIKTYLEVVTAETDLRTAQINYYNAMYNVLSSKVDVQRANGEILVNNK